MSRFEWRRVPVGLDGRRWVTRGDFRTVLVIVHTITSGQRLLDAVRLLESDLRLQVVFTMGPDVFNSGVEQFLADVGGVVLPWRQAVELEFDLALAASYGGIHEVHAPLVVMPHGAGFGKIVRRANRVVGGAVYGLDPQRLMRDGSVVPAAIVLPHEAELRRLALTCPEALPVAEVVGDPCHDRVVASLPFRESYRRALGVQQGQKLVVVTSTWGPRSLFGARDDVISRLMKDLPRDEYRVLAILHPNVWTGHGTWQIRAWLADHLRKGLSLIPPDAEWRAALVAADWLIGDHGSVALYGTLTGVPLLRTDFPVDSVDPSSAIPEFAKATPRVSPHRSMLTQLSKALAEYEPDQYEKVIARITSQPGKFNRKMRRLMYRLIGLHQPTTIPATDPVPLPHLCD